MLGRLSFAMFTKLSEQSLISELWEYFSNKYLTPDFGDYQHITVDYTGKKLMIILIGLLIGVNIASICFIFNKRYLGDFVRTLLSVDAIDKENAKTLEELGYQKNTIIRSSLKSGATLRRVVKCAEEEEYYSNANSNVTPRFIMDFEKCHFYIPEADKYTADIKFEKKGTNWLTYGFVLVISIALFLLTINFYSDLLQMLDNFLSMFAGK